MTAPKWASDLLVEVWEDHGGLASVPDLQWHRSRWQRSSSGRANAMRVHVTAGHERADQRIVLLHEIAHALQHHDLLASVPADGHSRRAFGHGAEFWRWAWRLFMQYHGPVPMVRFIQRECYDSAMAVSVALSLGIRGAAAYATAHQRRRAQVPKSTTTASADTKRCPGIPKADRPAHDEPLSGFNSNAARPDGLARMCRTCRKVYTAWLKKQAPDQPQVTDVADQPQASTVVERMTGTLPKTAPAKAAPADVQDGESPSATKARRAFVRQLAKVGSESDEGQRLMAQHADAAAEARKATRREQQRVWAANNRAAKKAALDAAATPASGAGHEPQQSLVSGLARQHARQPA